MTWQDWVDSEYDLGEFYATERYIKYNGINATRLEECFSLLREDKIKEQNVVVINFDGVSQPIAHRLGDFFSGVAYACDCKIKQISKDTHAIVPSNCEYNDITDTLENVLD